jgi:hypothetical protein
MSGEMRRPPQLWEQRLARTTAILGAGISSSGDATAIVPPSPAPGSGGGTEPAPVAPPVGSFSTPSTPTLIGAVTGINVVWNGLNSAGDLWPSDTSFVEVHMSTAGTGFTPDSSTLKGRLVRPGGLAVVGLTSGVTYHFRLRGADPAGNFTSPSAAASGSPGLITAPDIAAGAITANSITAGTITGWDINAAYLSGGTVSGGYITGGTINGATITSTGISGYATTGDIANFITGGQVNSNVTSISGGVITSGTIIGRTVQSSSGSARIVLNNADTLDFFSSNVKRGDIYGVTVSGLDGLGITGALDVSSTIFGLGLSISSSTVDMAGVYANNTTGIDSVGITTGNRLRRISSSQAIKYDIATLTKPLSASVDAAKICDVVTVNPTALLDVAVAEFSVIDDGEPTDRRVLGFIAEDVADKLPIAVSRDANGNPAGVLDTSLLAALLAVVQDQQHIIDDLTARIEALEA